MTIEKTLERLKKIHAQYEKQVVDLTQRLAVLQKELDDAKMKQIQTFDAIQALTGQPTFSKIMEKMNLTPVMNPVPPITQEPPPDNNLPAPEFGMKWMQTPTNDGPAEWVLVPINPPQPLFVPGVGSGIPDDFNLPSVDDGEKFEDPSTFL